MGKIKYKFHIIFEPSDVALVSYEQPYLVSTGIWTWQIYFHHWCTVSNFVLMDKEFVIKGVYEIKFTLI